MSKKISWDVAMVLRVLKNQVYTGALVSHRRKSCGVGIYSDLVYNRY